LFILFTCCSQGELNNETGEHLTPAELKQKAMSIISTQLLSNNPRTKVRAIEVVSETEIQDFAENLKNELTSDYVPVRFTAAVALGDMRYELARETLEKLIDVGDKNTKIAAAYALYKLGDKQKLEIIKKAAFSPDPRTRSNAVMLLGKTADESLIDLLKRVQYSDNSDDRVRLQALEARAKLQDITALKKLWAIIYSNYVEDRIIGITAMGALKTQKTYEILITKLDDDVPEVRLAAAEQLGKRNDSTGIPEVKAIFDDDITQGLQKEEKQRILSRAAFAIGAIDSRQLNKYLPQLLESDSEIVRLAAAAAVIKCVKN
jgi:HEAT repeat protein